MIDRLTLAAAVADVAFMVEQAWKQPRLFEEPAPKPVQEALAFADSSAKPAAMKPLG